MKRLLMILVFMLMFCNMAYSTELSLERKLYNASCDGDIKIVRLLLESGADPNCDKYNNCPLVMPVENGHLEVVKLLLQYGARLDVSYGGDVTLGTRLLISTISHFGQSPLGKDGSEAMINILLKAGADPKPANRSGESALLLACYKGLTDLAIRLIEMGASPRLATQIGSPLEMIFSGHSFYMQHYFAEDEYIPLVKLILSKGVDPYIPSSQKKTPAVELALKNGYYNLLVLMDKDRKYKAQYEKLKNDWPLLKMYSAIAGGRIDLVKEYLKNGVSANGSHPKNPSTFLGVAAWQSNPEIVKALLEAGANPNIPGNDRETVLSIAYEHPENLRLLLKAGADPNGKDPRGSTPLQNALRAKTLEPIELLVNNGAIVDKSVLALAFRYNNGPKIIKFLQDHSNDPPQQQLIYAAEFGNSEQLKLILQSNTQVNFKDKNGVTPLMAAARKGKLDNIDLLLKAGADPLQLDKTGKSAADYAAETPFIRTLKRLDTDHKYGKLIEKYAPSPKSISNRVWTNKLVEHATVAEVPPNTQKKAYEMKTTSVGSPEKTKIFLDRVLITQPVDYAEIMSRNGVIGDEAVFQKKVGNSVVGKLKIQVNDLSKNDPEAILKLEKGNLSIYSIYKQEYRKAERGGDYAPKFIELAGHKAVVYEYGQTFLRREYQTLIGTIYVKFTLYAKDDEELKYIDNTVHNTRVVGLNHNIEPVDNTASMAWFQEHIYYSPPLEYDLDKKLTKDGAGNSSIYFQKINKDGDLLGSIQFLSCDLRISDSELAEKVIKRQVNYSQQLMDQAQSRHVSESKNAKLLTIAGRQAFSNETETTRRSKHGILVYKYKMYTLQIDNIVLTISVNAINEAELDKIDASIEQILIP